MHYRPALSVALSCQPILFVSISHTRLRHVPLKLSQVLTQRGAAGDVMYLSEDIAAVPRS